MKIKQISIVLENRSRELAACTEILSKNGIEIIAMVLVNKSGHRILHFVVSDPEKACRFLQRSGWGIGETEVLLLELSDKTISLDMYLKAIKINNNIDIEYMYMGNNCQFVFRLNDLDAAIEVYKNGSEH